LGQRKDDIKNDHFIIIFKNGDRLTQRHGNPPQIVLLQAGTEQV
jgi:predicted nuclease of predicted toxin-antitoxin system